MTPSTPQARPEVAPWIVTRRDFLKASSSVLAGLAAAPSVADSDEPTPGRRPRFGIVTDAHYADTVAAGSRYYRESLPKLTECVTLMNEKKVDFLVELGDLKDQDTPPVEENTLAYLRTVESVFRTFEGPRYHVLGNHDVDSLSKAQFLRIAENTGISRESTYYSFDSNGVHCVVLDANYRRDGSDYDHGNFDWTDTNIPREELDWLRNDLASAATPAIVFVHQQLDGEGSHTIKNAAEVRRVLEESQRVLAVFQGHNHAGHYSLVNGVHYYTLKAVVEGPGEANNAYAIVEVLASLDLVVTGYRRAENRELNALP